MKWAYHSENLAGNLHDATDWINKSHPEWDVITLHPIGNYTIVVYRLPIQVEE